MYTYKYTYDIYIYREREREIYRYEYFIFYTYIPIFLVPSFSSELLGHPQHQFFPPPPPSINFFLLQLSEEKYYECLVSKISLDFFPIYTTKTNELETRFKEGSDAGG